MMIAAMLEPPSRRQRRETAEAPVGIGGLLFFPFCPLGFRGVG